MHICVNVGNNIVFNTKPESLTVSNHKICCISVNNENYEWIIMRRA